MSTSCAQHSWPNREWRLVSSVRVDVDIDADIDMDADMHMYIHTYIYIYIYFYTCKKDMGVHICIYICWVALCIHEEVRSVLGAAADPKSAVWTERP